MGSRSLWSLCLLLALLPAQVLSQDDFNLGDAIDDESKAPTPTPKPGLPAGGAGADDVFKNDGTTTTKAPPKVVPPVTKSPVKPKPKPDEKQSPLFPTMRPGLLPSTKLPPRSLPASDEFDLADALDPNNDIGGKDRNKGQGGGFSDSDLADVGKSDTYKPDKGKGGHASGGGGQINPTDDNNDTMAETGTIAGIVSAVAMALVGAVSSYISYQKKKLCFSIQQSLNTDMVKTENPEAVVATEPQVQQTLLEPPNAEPPSEENAM